jgi:hypothetical protein
VDASLSHSLAGLVGLALALLLRLLRRRLDRDPDPRAPVGGTPRQAERSGGSASNRPGDADDGHAAGNGDGSGTRADSGHGSASPHLPFPAANRRRRAA